jgi:hypothetical protein
MSPAATSLNGSGAAGGGGGGGTGCDAAALGAEIGRGARGTGRILKRLLTDLRGVEAFNR